MRREAGVRAAFGLLLFGLLYFGAWLERYSGSAPYRTALDYVESSAELRAILGADPVVARFPRGRVDEEEREAKFTLRLRGPADAARVELELARVDGVWRIVSANYRTQTGRVGALPAEDEKRLRLGVSHSARGYSLYQHGRLREALEAFDQAVALDRDNATTLFWRAWIHHDLDDLESAAADAERAVALSPLDNDAHYTLGIVYGRQGDYPRSLRHFDRAIELDDDDGIAYYARSVTRSRLGDATGAREDRDRACALGYEDACE